MRKVVYSLAVSALLTGLFSCSSDNELAEVRELVANSQPIKFAVAVEESDMTRAQRTTKDNFVKYQVWATSGDETKPWLFGTTALGAFSNDVWNETSNTGTWDELDSTDPNCFFALSANGGTTTVVNAGLTMTELANNDDVESNLLTAPNKYVEYSMPTENSLIDLSNQVDIMAAYAPNITKGAEVPLNFKHIFSNMELKVLMTDCMWNPGTTAFDSNDDSMYPFDVDAWYYIRYIVIHGLKANGQYTFSSHSWSLSGDPVDIKIPVDRFFYYKDLGAAGVGATAENHLEIEHSLYDDVMVGTNSIMVIPQTITPWGATAVPTANECCVEVYGVSAYCFSPIDDRDAFETTIRSYMNEDGTWNTDWTAEEDFGAVVIYNPEVDNQPEKPEVSVYFPLSPTISQSPKVYGFTAGKKYTIWLNLGYFRFDNGEKLEDI